MLLAVWQRDSGFPSRLVPFFTTLVFVLLSVMPLRLPGFAIIMPSFALMAVCHWTFYRPDLMPLSVVFVLGILLDLLNGTPLVGTSALGLLAARTTILIQRRHFVGRAFPVLWLGFLALAVGFFVLIWGFVSLLQGHVLGVRPFLFQAVLTVACFPVGSYFIAWVHRAFLRS